MSCAAVELQQRPIVSTGSAQFETLAEGGPALKDWREGEVGGLVMQQRLAAQLQSHWLTTLVITTALALDLVAFVLRREPWMIFAAQALTLGFVFLVVRAQLEQGRQKAARESSLHRTAAAQARITRFLAWNKGDLRMAKRTGRHASDLFAATGNRRRAMLTANDVAWIQGCLGDLDAQGRTAHSILDWSEPAADDRISVDALISLGCVESQRGVFGEAEIALNRAIALAARQKLSRHESAARGFLGALKAIEGRSYSEALSPDYEPWRPVDGIGREAFVLADWLHGEYRAAMEREAAAERPSASVKPRRDWILPFVAMAAAEIDQVETAHSLTAQLQLRYGSGDFIVLKALIAWAQGIVAWREQDLERSVRHLAAGASELYRMHCYAFAALSLFDLIEVAQECGHPAVEESVEMIDRLASATGDPIHAALNAASRARSARDGEQSSPAAALASNAAAHLLAANYRPHTARTLTLLGQLLAPHDRAQAIRHLESAINLHLATGAAWRLERCFSQLRKLGHEGRRVVAQTRGPASLTKREREDIELARRGRTTS